ncbi:ATP-binding protein [Polyangium spumosum]|uniref:ATP-binding protein n=1 Tax=Polyangium spumosum TaxID=889282 RepID=UPI001F0EFE40|nr:ATP-binding protein [Polyangium spumosum]
MSDLKGRLKHLGLRAAAEGIDDLCARAIKARSSPVELLEHVVEMEEKERAKNSLERRLSRSHIGHFKPMADFDWDWPTKIDRELVESALRLEFLAQPRNVVLVASHGLGKSMIARNIAHEAVIAGNSVIFTTAAQLLLDLGARESSRSLAKRLKHYAKASLLVLDGLGYLSFDARNADLLFQLVNLRYEKKSIVLTTNLAFSDWPTIFPNATCATALIDRVVHHAHQHRGRKLQAPGSQGGRWAPQQRGRRQEEAVAASSPLAGRPAPRRRTSAGLSKFLRILMSGDNEGELCDVVGGGRGVGAGAQAVDGACGAGCDGEALYGAGGGAACEGSGCDPNRARVIALGGDSAAPVRRIGSGARRGHPVGCSTRRRRGGPR